MICYTATHSCNGPTRKRPHPTPGTAVQPPWQPWLVTTAARCATCLGGFLVGLPGSEHTGSSGLPGLLILEKGTKSRSSPPTPGGDLRGILCCGPFPSSGEPQPLLPLANISVHLARAQTHDFSFWAKGDELSAQGEDSGPGSP